MADHPAESICRDQSDNQTVRGAHHRWPVTRTTHEFRCRLVEPEAYDPASHTAIFNRLMVAAVAPPRDHADEAELALGADFDLMTFPEAFLPAPDLLVALETLQLQREMGCVHVGLRPDTGKDHLFTVAQLCRLVADLKDLEQAVVADMAPFEAWLDRQVAIDRFNVACLFRKDRDGRLRICLHPKNLRSPLEESAFPNENVKEGDLLSVVTLVPHNAIFATVSIQPLICSDVLDLQKLDGGPGPIAAMTAAADRFLEGPSEIDVVSVATCTPQRNQAVGKVGSDLVWQPKFREAFVDAQTPARWRHNRALFVLSNFRIGPEKVACGLSGCFLPLSSPKEPRFPDGICAWSYGRNDRFDNAWHSIAPGGGVGNHSSRGHLVGLDAGAVSGGEVARIFSFNVPLILRQRSQWESSIGLTNMRSIALPALADAADAEDTDV